MPTKSEAVERIVALGGRLETFKGTPVVRMLRHGADYVQIDGKVLSINGGLFFDPPTADYVRWEVRYWDYQYERTVGPSDNTTAAADIAAWDYFYADVPVHCGHPNHAPGCLCEGNPADGPRYRWEDDAKEDN